MFRRITRNLPRSHFRQNCQVDQQCLDCRLCSCFEDVMKHQVSRIRVGGLVRIAMISCTPRWCKFSRRRSKIGNKKMSMWSKLDHCMFGPSRTGLNIIYEKKKKQSPPAPSSPRSFHFHASSIHPNIMNIEIKSSLQVRRLSPIPSKRPHFLIMKTIDRFPPQIRRQHAYTPSTKSILPITSVPFPPFSPFVHLPNIHRSFSQPSHSRSYATNFTDSEPIAFAFMDFSGAKARGEVCRGEAVDY